MIPGASSSSAALARRGVRAAVVVMRDRAVHSAAACRQIGGRHVCGGDRGDLVDLRFFLTWFGGWSGDGIAGSRRLHRDQEQKAGGPPHRGGAKHRPALTSESGGFGLRDRTLAGAQCPEGSPDHIEGAAALRHDVDGRGVLTQPEVVARACVERVQIGQCAREGIQRLRHVERSETRFQKRRLVVNLCYQRRDVLE
jgi:hypothetical protein